MKKDKFLELAIDNIYQIYCNENSMENILYNHPMFYNGTFSVNNEHKPEKPEKLLTKEEFVEMLDNDSSSKWNTALHALYIYILKNQILDEISDDITAENMKKLATNDNENVNNLLTNDLLKQIKTKAEKGETELYISHYEIKHSIKQELERRGFKVEMGGRYNEINTIITWG